MKIVIIGGVAGGASAAARARRLDEKAEIVVLQSGPDVSFASCGMVRIAMKVEQCVETASNRSHVSVSSYSSRTLLEARSPTEIPCLYKHPHRSKLG